MGAPGRLAALEMLKDVDGGGAHEGRRRRHRRRATTASPPRRSWRRRGMKPRRARAARDRRAARRSPRSSTRASRPRPSPTPPGPLRASSSRRSASSVTARVDPSPSRASSRRCPTAAACASGAIRSGPPPSSARFSAKDARALSRVPRDPRPHLRACSAGCSSMTPPDVDAARPAATLWPLPGSAWAFRRPRPRATPRTCCAGGRWRWRTSSQEWFETDAAARGRSRPAASTGAFAGPWSAGTTANLLLQAAASRRQRRRLDGVREGRPRRAHRGARRRGAALGAEIRTGAEVAAHRCRRTAASRASSSRAARRSRRAPWSPASTRSRRFLRLLDPALLDPDDLRRIRNYQQPGHGLEGQPRARRRCRRFTAARRRTTAALSRPHPHRRRASTTSSAPSTTRKYGEHLARPYLDVTIPTLTDPSLAPAGPARDVGLRAVHAVPAEDAALGRARATRSATPCSRRSRSTRPGFGALVVGRQVLTPLDLERDLRPDRRPPAPRRAVARPALHMRPLLGWARYRAPVAGLYLCGAGTHPGGGVTGGPGANAAREMLRDLR